MYELKPEYSLDPHQQDVVDFAESRVRGGSSLWLATGVGKGFIAIFLICLWLNRGITRILVSPPAALTVDWMKKLLLYAGIEAVAWDDAEEGDMIRVISHTMLQKQPKAKARRRDRLAEIYAWNPEAMIVDEIQLLSNYKAAQTKGLMEIVRRCALRFRVGMTGTEITRIDPEQLRPQLLFADAALLEQYAVADWMSWRKKFCHIKTERFGDVVRETVVGVKNKDLLDEILAQVCIKMDDSVLKLEKPVFEEVYFKMSPKAQRYYRLMEESGAILEGELEILTDNPLTRTNRLLQIRSGFVADWEGKIHDLDEELIKAVCLKVKSVRKPLLVFYHYRHTGDRLAKALREAGYRLDTIQSGVSAAKKSQIEQQFQDGHLDIVLGQFQALARGYTLTAGAHTLYAEPEIDLEPWLQSLGRTRRRGQTEQCHYHKFICTQLDMDWYAALENKEDFKAMISSGAYRIGRNNG